MSGLILLFIILSGIASPTLANTGVNWLTAQAQPSGHYNTPEEIDIPFIATAETLHTLYEMGETHPSMTAALETINTLALSQNQVSGLSTETLAKILIIRAKASQPVDALTTELLTRLNYYGGLGDLRDYDSSVIDTCLALTALAQSPNVDTALETLYPTIDLLLKQQQEDGGWGDNGNESSVYLTARSLHALWHYRYLLENIPSLNVIPALDKAQAYLLNKLNQGELDTFEIALALIAILPRLSKQDDIATPLAALRAAQLDNGSWDNDVYTTALVLRALYLATKPSDSNTNPTNPNNPDLVITQVNNEDVNTNLQTLWISGSVTVRVENQGNASTANAFALLAFYDVNFNDVYEENVDRLLGSAIVETLLGVGENGQAEIAIAGALPFQDAPIKVWVDSLQSVVERNEENNIGMTASRCQMIPEPILTGVYGIGNQDLHFTYFEPNNPEPLIPVGLPAHRSWVNPSSGAWIGPPNGNLTGKYGKYIYRYTFMLSNTKGVSLYGKWSSDNGTVAYLNDQLIIDSPGPYAWTFETQHPFLASSKLFQVGSNELRFEVDNGGGPTSLYVNANLIVPEESLTKISDPTAGLLQIIDNGVGQPITLQVRIGNAGLAPSTANLPLTFYAGDPDNNGSELGTVMLDVFEPGTYQDVQLANVDLPDLNQDIYAVIDVQNTLEECNEGNNSVSTSVNEGTPTLHGEVSITSDAPTYGPNTPVVIDYTITNSGALPADFQIEVRLEDDKGNLLETLKSLSNVSLTSGETLTSNANWETGTQLSGHYQIHVKLLSAEGQMVKEAIHPFTITAATEGPVVTLRTTTDKPSYHTNDIVLINHLFNNSSLNTLIEDALLTLTIKGPDGEVVHTESQALKPLSPQALQEILTPYKLQEAAKGTYTVTVVINGHDDTTLITQTTTFKVENDLKFSIDGQLQIDSAQLTRGQKQHCTATLTNQGTEFVSDLAVQYLLVNLDTQATVNTQTARIDLASGESHTKTLNYDTLSLPITHYACVLQAKIENEWQPLDFKTFNLHSILSSECSTVYAIHDQDRSDTQLFTYDLNNGSIKPLGPLYPERDLEGLDIHPFTHQLYASTGQPRSRLEQVNGYSGDLTPIGYIGFQHVTSLSFDPFGQLWGGAKGGLIQIDTDTGQGQMIKPNNLKMEGLSWNNAGTLLYMTAVTEPNPHSSLWVYDPQTTELRKHCDNLEGEVESLETLPDDRLAFGIHDDHAFSFHVYDPEQCQTVQGSLIQTPYNDIEAIAWPSANCTTMQKALQAFFITLSENEDIYLGEDRNLRVSIDGQIYQGQLALEKNQGLPPSDGQLQIIAIPDANEDGIDDFFITYPDGQQQILYFQGLTSE